LGITSGQLGGKPRHSWLTISIQVAGEVVDPGIASYPLGIARAPRLRPAGRRRYEERMKSVGTGFDHVIVDRDGVLNREPARGWVLSCDDLVWEAGAPQALALLASAGVRVSVATNQSCVGRGLLSLEGLDAVHEELRRRATAAGGAIDALFVCPHAPEDACSCRKPLPGLIRSAMEASSIAAARTVVVGDAERDLEAAAAAGVVAVLVRTGKGRDTEAGGRCRPTAVFDDLLAAARWIVRAPSDP
jgi:D-glycero-D-manno-heptose 1,7-bisphosphate phosphatase